MESSCWRGRRASGPSVFVKFGATLFGGYFWFIRFRPALSNFRSRFGGIIRARGTRYGSSSVAFAYVRLTARDWFAEPCFSRGSPRNNFGGCRVRLLFWSGMARILPAVLLRSLDRLFVLLFSSLFGSPA